jgi:hypothetical protein
MPSSNRSSSNPAVFWRGAVVGLVTTIVALLAVTMVVDPFGALGPVSGEAGVCRSGIKDIHFEEQSKLLLPIVRQPQVILVGNSRVARGFDEVSLGRFSHQPVANLGISTGILTDMARLTEAAVSRAPVKMIVVAVDFGSFIANPHAGRVALLDPDLPDRLALLRYGLLDPKAMTAAIRAAAWCRNLASTIDGAGLPSLRNEQSEDAASVAAGFVAMHSALSRDPADDQQRYLAANMANFRMLVANATRSGIRFAIVFGPNHSQYQATLIRAGQGNLYARWEEEIKAVASSNAAILIDGRSASFLQSAALPPCASASGLDCHFWDAVHFSPVIGDALVRAIESAALPLPPLRQEHGR